jgi:hypothetical protein
MRGTPADLVYQVTLDAYILGFEIECNPPNECISFAKQYLPGSGLRKVAEWF